jgi:hypothetical protein
MENPMASGTEGQEISPVMLAGRAAADVVDLHPAPHVQLRPPADGARAELGGELLEQELVSFG